jgi:hypothetical protein
MRNPYLTSNKPTKEVMTSFYEAMKAGVTAKRLRQKPEPADTATTQGGEKTSGL